MLVMLQVMSRGNIVLSGHKHHHFGDRDAPVSNSDDRVAQGKLIYSQNLLP